MRFRVIPATAASRMRPTSWEDGDRITVMARKARRGAVGAARGDHPKLLEMLKQKDMREHCSQVPFPSIIQSAFNYSSGQDGLRQKT
jgi:hypothetical protein